MHFDRGRDCFTSLFASFYVWCKWQRSLVAQPLPHLSPLDEIMASATSPTVKYLLQTINADEFMKDAAKGSEAKEFARKEYSITTVDGLQFCKVQTFDDPVSRRYPLSSHPSDTVNSGLLGSSSLLLTGLA